MARGSGIQSELTQMMNEKAPPCTHREEPGRPAYWPLIVWLVLLLFQVAVLVFLQLKYDILHYMAPERIGETVASLRALMNATGVWGPLVIIASCSIGMLASVPFFPVVLVCVLGYGWLPGVPFAMLAAGLGTTLMYLFGQWFRPALKRLFGHKMDKIDARAMEREMLSVVTLRLIFYLTPMANWALSVSGLSYRNIMLGTLIGAAPGLLIQAWIVSILLEWSQHANATDLLESAQFAFSLITGIGLLMFIRGWLPRYLKRRRGAG